MCAPPGPSRVRAQSPPVRPVDALVEGIDRHQAFAATATRATVASSAHAASDASVASSAAAAAASAATAVSASRSACAISHDRLPGSAFTATECAVAASRAGRASRASVARCAWRVTASACCSPVSVFTRCRIAPPLAAPPGGA